MSEPETAPECGGPALCILAAGKGTRLGPLTAQLNKALLPVGHRAAISRILDQVPRDTPVVVALGYEGDQVREYCQAVYPERRFTFVGVDNLDGPGSGPGYSLLCCREFLQQPFWLVNVDTLVDSGYPALTENWLGVYPTREPTQYATVALDPVTQALTLWDKVAPGGEHAYIGIAGIRDYARFWTALAAGQGRDPEYQYVQALIQLAPRLYWLSGWMDTGSPHGYRQAQERYASGRLGLPKVTNEITYHDQGRLVKLCWEREKTARRVATSLALSGVVPALSYAGQYVVAYPWVVGGTLAYQQDFGLLVRFLEWLETHLWESRSEVASDAFRRQCLAFYEDKTRQRLREYHRHRPDWDARLINGFPCEPVEAYLTYLDWNWLSRGISSRIHGDLQLDNALLVGGGQFLLIDWREDFGSLVGTGDRYYDLAKLYAVGLDLPYSLLEESAETLVECPTGIWYRARIPIELVLFREYYERWLTERGYDLPKVKILAALIQLNMAPLHPDPVGALLYHHANLRLATLCRRDVSGKEPPCPRRP